MALQSTVAQILINDALPEELRDYNRVLDKKSLANLLRQVAQKYPEKYREVSHKLNQIGGKIAFESGGNSPLVKDLVAPDVVRKFRARITPVLSRIINNPNLSPEVKNQRLIDILADEAEPLQKAVFEELKEKQNPLARQILSGARGNPLQLNSLVGADLLYADHRNRPIPVPVLSSYSQGLSPAEYFASSYGARKGVIDLKKGTAEAGYLGKQLSQLAHRLMVTAIDREDGADLGVRGLPVDTTDPDNEGALLAHPVGGFYANTVLTPAILRKLQAAGHSRILVRSPAVLSPPEGGVYARDVGVREKGGLPAIGEIVGLAAAQALSEPLTQAKICLAEGTLVRMADWSTKKIEEVQPGDQVLGADREGRTFPVAVLQTFANGLRECVRTTFRCRREVVKVELVSTLEHKVLCLSSAEPGTGEIATVGKAIHSDLSVLQVADGSEEASAEGLVPTALISAGILPTYDLEVDHPDHLFVLANGLIVSNSSKHSGGVASGGQAVSGFDYIASLFNPAQHIRGGAAHADIDGVVGKIEPAPAGGYHVSIDGKEHYVPAGRTLRVKSGDTVEAGDLLSDGVPSAALLVHHKGIGEGRRLLMKELQTAYQAARITAHRRNLELLARGLVDHIRLTDDSPDGVPDDVMSYQEYERNYQPREGSTRLAPASAKGKFLERPVLHYSIGTRIRPSVVKTLQEFGINEIEAHDDPPPFVPEMVRAANILQHDPDWMTRFYGSGLKKSLSDAVHRGLTSRTDSTSFIPALAKGVGFGQEGPFQTPKQPIPVDPPAMPTVQPLNKAFPSFPEIKTAEAPPAPTPAEAKVPGKVSPATAATLTEAPAAAPPTSPQPPAPRKPQGLAALRSYDEKYKDWQKNLSRAFLSSPGLNPAPAKPAAPVVSPPAPVVSQPAPVVSQPAPVVSPPDQATALSQPRSNAATYFQTVSGPSPIPASRVATPSEVTGMKGIIGGQGRLAREWDHMTPDQRAVAAQSIQDRQRVLQQEANQRAQANEAFDNLGLPAQAAQVLLGKAPERAFDNDPAYTMDTPRKGEFGLQVGLAGANQLGLGYRGGATSAVDALQNPLTTPLSLLQAQAPRYLTATGLRESSGAPLTAGDRAFYGSVDAVPFFALQGADEAVKRKALETAVTKTAPALAKVAPNVARVLTPDRLITAGNILQGVQAADQGLQLVEAGGKARDAAIAADQAQIQAQRNAAKGISQAQQILARDRAKMTPEEVAAMEQSIADRRRALEREIAQEQAKKQEWGEKWPWQRASDLIFNPDAVPNEAFAQNDGSMAAFDYLGRPLAQVARYGTGLTTLGSDSLETADAQALEMGNRQQVKERLADPTLKSIYERAQRGEVLEPESAAEAQKYLGNPVARQLFDRYQRAEPLTPQQQQMAETYAAVLQQYQQEKEQLREVVQTYGDMLQQQQNEQAQLRQAWSQRPWYGKLYDRAFHPSAVPE